MGNRVSPRPPEPPPDPPRWQQVIAPRAEKAREVPEPKPGIVVQVPEDRLHDHREIAPLFARLPEHAKEDLRDRWRAAEGKGAEQVVRRKDTSHRWVVEGAALFFLSVALLQTPTRPELILAAFAGAAIGWGAARVKPPPLSYGLVFATAYGLFGAFSGFKNLIFALISVGVVFGVAVALAATHRLQRFDSSEL
ncbi:MAG TPA: hypothetical protein VFY93_04175 [Planctomycetota bacterium]|nr:hypothetical protein [Planctomycetota bacterium]